MVSLQHVGHSRVVPSLFVVPGKKKGSTCFFFFTSDHVSSISFFYFFKKCSRSFLVAFSTPGVGYSGYDSVGYTSASTPSYYQQTQQTLSQPQPPPQQTHQPQTPVQPLHKPLTSSSWSNSGSNMVTGPTINTYKKPIFHQNKLLRPKGPPKQPQLHYCDICKISCAGPQVSNKKQLYRSNVERF